ncbi:hypothetical protein EXIGLDRAFT_841704 [Exidia glandulosa HHB12029]|uniref:Zn(2)-C6 fungal-type domain-containing protein n=1 Tax=Exidia glandulosa HHB12029 TaxID=1314781 RepID=A0A165DPX1_EXIGL|nr:hypothetical protein EXIGLDRAFT_841704 [Exidia glandulosa HHB12029]
MGKDNFVEATTRRAKGSHSCDPCRRRKVKCNEESPCGNCKNSNIADKCTYEGDDKRKGRRGVVEALRNTITLYKERIVRLKARVVERGGANTPSPPSSPSASAANIHERLATNSATAPPLCQQSEPVCLDHTLQPYICLWNEGAARSQIRELTERLRDVQNQLDAAHNKLEEVYGQFDQLIDGVRTSDQDEDLHCPSCSMRDFGYMPILQALYFFLRTAANVKLTAACHYLQEHLRVRIAVNVVIDALSRCKMLKTIEPLLRWAHAHVMNFLYVRNSLAHTYISFYVPARCYPQLRDLVAEAGLRGGPAKAESAFIITLTRVRSHSSTTSDISAIVERFCFFFSLPPESSRWLLFCWQRR